MRLLYNNFLAWWNDMLEIHAGDSMGEQSFVIAFLCVLLCSGSLWLHGLTPWGLTASASFNLGVFDWKWCSVSGEYIVARPLKWLSNKLCSLPRSCLDAFIHCFNSVPVVKCVVKCWVVMAWYFATLMRLWVCAFSYYLDSIGAVLQNLIDVLSIGFNGCVVSK